MQCVVHSVFFSLSAWRFGAIFLNCSGGGVTCICRDTGCAIILGTFLGLLPDFWVPFGLFPDFWISFFGYSRIFGYHFLVKLHFFENNPSFGYWFWYFHQWHCRMLPAGLLFLWFYGSRFCYITFVQRVPCCLHLLSVWVRIFLVLFYFNIILPLWIIFNVLRF